MNCSNCAGQGTWMGRFCHVCGGAGERDIADELGDRATSYDAGGESSAHTANILRAARAEIVALRERVKIKDEQIAGMRTYMAELAKLAPSEIV